MAEEIKARFRRQGTTLTAKLLMPHPMEPGTRKETVVENGAETERLIPAHYIETFTCKVNGRVVLDADMSGSVSTDPILTFYVDGVNAGDEVSVEWTDNKGETMSRVDTIK